MRAVGLVIGLVVLNAGLAAQTPPPLRRILRPEGEFPIPFTTISASRALSDGRLLVGDGREATLQLVDFERGTAVTIGRRGNGPQEWSGIFRLLPWRGDTTLMPDPINRRVLVIHPDGTLGRDRSLDSSTVARTGDVIGLGAQGELLVVTVRRSTERLAPMTGIRDLVRLQDGGGRMDSLAVLDGPKGEMSAATIMPDGSMLMATNRPLAARDLAIGLPGGRAVVVRTNPYRIEWYDARGRGIGPPAQASAVPVTEAEREAFLRSQRGRGPVLLAKGPPSPPSAKTGQSPAPSRAEIKSMMNPEMTWPAVKPPFAGNAAHPAPNDHVWVERARPWNDSTRVFDVFDATGRVGYRVALPRGSRLVALGVKYVYLAHTDDDDLLWLQRVAYPEK